MISLQQQEPKWVLASLRLGGGFRLIPDLQLIEDQGSGEGANCTDVFRNG